MAQFNVNIDHVATIRQARMVDEPDPLTAGLAVSAAATVVSAVFRFMRMP